MKFSLCNEMFEGWEFDRVCAATSRAGFTGIEIAPFTLAALASAVSADQRRGMREVAAGHGIEIVGLHWLLAKTSGFHVSHPDVEVRRRTVDYFIELANLCADLGGRIMVFGSPQQRNVCDGLTYEQAWDYAADTFREIVPVLEQRGVTFCVEPLSTEETDFLTTAAEAARMVHAVGSDRFQLMLDVKAMSSESTPLPEIIRASGSLVKHFHANDANKRGPGFGNTDFRPIAAALRDINYQGWVSVEVFDFKPDPVTIAQKSMDYLADTFS